MTSDVIICEDVRVRHYRLDSCESTQDIARELAVGGVYAVSCGHMTKGRGRLGRRWYAGRGGAWVTVSAELPTESRGSVLPLAVGARLADWLRKRYGVDVRVKWPNDLLINGMKVGGVLIEAVSSGVTRVLVGVGINVANDIPDDLAGHATRLADWVSDASPDEVVEGIVCSVVSAIRDVLEGGDRVLSLWRRLSDTLGREVWVILDDGREVRGVAVDVDLDGALIISGDGGVHRVLVGEVIHLRPTSVKENHGVNTDPY